MEKHAKPTAYIAHYGADSLNSFKDKAIATLAAATVCWQSRSHQAHQWLECYTLRIQTMKDKAKSDLGPARDLAEAEDTLAWDNPDAIKPPIATSTPIHPDKAGKKVDFDVSRITDLKRTDSGVVDVLLDMQRQLMAMQKKAEATAASIDKSWMGELADAIKGSDERGSAKLPFLTLNKCSGSILEWRAFYENFMTNVHSRKKLSDHDKWTYLKGLIVKGSDAERVIRGFSDAGSSYVPALTLLRDRF